jgi:hypothetical protein
MKRPRSALVGPTPSPVRVVGRNRMNGQPDFCTIRRGTIAFVQYVSYCTGQADNLPGNQGRPPNAAAQFQSNIRWINAVTIDAQPFPCNSIQIVKERLRDCVIDDSTAGT